MTSELTPLERTCIELVASEHWPTLRLDGLRVTRRENSGVGRYVYLEDTNRQVLPDGTYETSQRAIEMEGLPLGLDFAIAVLSSHIHHLEIVTASTEGWDGVERGWKVIGSPPGAGA
jgi:hypothetical protein